MDAKTRAAFNWLVRNDVKTREELRDYSDEEIVEMHDVLIDDSDD